MKITLIHNDRAEGSTVLIEDRSGDVVEIVTKEAIKYGVPLNKIHCIERIGDKWFAVSFTREYDRRIYNPSYGEVNQEWMEKRLCQNLPEYPNVNVRLVDPGNGDI